MITLPTPTGTRGLTAEALPPGPLAQFVDDIPAGIAVFDRDLRYIAANERWIEAFGLTAMALAGQRHLEIDPVRGRELASLLRRALAGDAVEGRAALVGDAEGGVRHRAVSVRPRRSRDGTIIGVIAALNEIAVSPPEAASHEHFDRLTGIAGRHRFIARVQAALADAEPAGGTALLLLDIDNFKAINDLYGTRIGDRVLAEIANRLQTGVRSRPAPSPSPSPALRQPDADLVARLGADEFGVVLGSLGTNHANVEALASRLLQLLSAPIAVGDHRIRLTGNIGFLISGPSHRSADHVLRDLNAALQEAKASGPNTAKPWQPALSDAVGRRVSMLDELRRALDEGEFVLHYQPIVSLEDEQVIGAEALLRWNHPRNGLVSPADFLPLLEESGLIVPVGCWVIREVVRQMQVWQMLYGRDMLEWVSVNVSARQFNDPGLLLATLSEINDSGFPLDRLKLEITESAVMRNPEVTREVIGELQDLGIRIALDDFGTGYSALGAMRHYSVDMIKIDRDFTARLDTKDGRELMLALLTIARIYGASVVTEGIETEAQRDLLRDSGCGFGQGYLFAKPMPGSALGAYVLTHLVEENAAAD